MMRNNSPKISVITVVYNNVKDIERTVLSVLQQNYPQVEYVVIDGKSTDGTLDILAKYKDKISVLRSEPDQGIYDAMNKGLRCATGDYVVFMNSGDEFYAHNTLSSVMESKANADVYYGETEMYNAQWRSLGRRRHQAPERLSWRSFKYGMSVCHQAIYIKRSLTAPYDLQYKYSADIDWILKVLKQTDNTVFVPHYVAKYLVGGVSKQKHLESLKERYQIFKKYYGTFPNIFNHIVIAIRLLGYYILQGKTND